MALDYTALDPQLEAVSTVIGASRQKLQGAIPDLLFHYTNSAGLRGILDTSRLWATDYRFLNDASEIAYGVSLFDAMVTERLAQDRTEVGTEFLRRSARTANAFDGMLDCYVACFCESDDLLHQWHLYGESGGGYALGFRTREIGLRWGTMRHDQDFTLRRVLYEVSEQRRLIAEVIDRVLEVLESNTRGKSIDEATVVIARCCALVRSEIADYLYSFKHPAFSVEREWRMCRTVDPRLKGQELFRDGRYGVTPYVLIDPSPMAGVNAEKLPLAKITLGPTVNPSNARVAVERLVRAKGYGFVEVAGSDLPIRAGS